MSTFGPWLVVLVIFFVVIGIIVYKKVTKKKKDECSDGTCDPDKKKDPCDDGSCDKPVEPVEPVKPKEPLTIQVSLTANNEGTKVPEGVFCTRTKSIKASEIITGNDCDECVVRQWFDNGTENINNKGKLEIFPPFFTGHEIKYKATIGTTSKEVAVKIA